MFVLYFALRLVQKTCVNQLDAELLPIIAWSSAFSRALGSLIIFIARSHWLSGYFPFFLIFFFPHVSRTQRLAPARTRTRVVRLGAQCTDHWPTGQSRGVSVPAVQLIKHVKSSTLYGRTSKFFRLDGLLLFCIIMGLRSASSAIILWYPVSSANPNSAEFNAS